ncbi:MAG TPA: isocitrate lyase/phosphoenolpyruvate mutase family protein, partial [Steroidobacteraceae bacterium]
MKTRAEAFRALHVAGRPLVLFNVWDAGSAKAVAAAGASAIATGSWSVAAANGFTDGEQIPLDMALENLRRIVAATVLPVTVDLESGYGKSAVEVGRTIGRAIEAGAVGCNLEDSFPESGKLRESTEQT